MEFLIPVLLAIADGANPVPHDWTTIIGGIIVAIITGFYAWWNNRAKNKGDSFKVFMDESAEFREEVRKEREALKVELKEARNEIDSLRAKNKDHQKQIDLCEQQYEKCSKDLTKTNESLELFRIKMESLKSNEQ